MKGDETRNLNFICALYTYMFFMPSIWLQIESFKTLLSHKEIGCLKHLKTSSGLGGRPQPQNNQPGTNVKNLLAAFKDKGDICCTADS